MIKPRITYANVAATLALVFSMTGGALAAKHYLISSTKQISPKVIKALKGKTGPAGPQGLPGKEGPAGKEGKEGKEATNAVNSAALGGVGANHYVTSSSTLPSGDTETGTYGTAAGSGQLGVTSITFIPKLAAAPSNSEYVPSGTTVHCPGGDQATAGYLCVYGGWNYEMTFECVGGFVKACASLPTVDGASIYFRSKEAEGNTTGTWAFKAP